MKNAKKFIHDPMGMNMKLLKNSIIFSEKQKIEFANVIKNNLFSEKRNKVTIFLCGGDVNDSKYGRYKISQILSRNDRLEIFYPEDLFDDLLAGQGQYSLLSMENMLAESVDAIIIIPESPGSYSELGAFANNEKLASKMICIQDNKFRFKKSFLNYGPIRLLKKNSPTSVLRYDFNVLDDALLNEGFYQSLMKSIKIIQKKSPVKKSVDNILMADRFILPCIYLMDGINNVLLYDLLSKATGKANTLCEIIVKSALSKLMKERVIVRTSEGYHITDAGMEYVLLRFDRLILDKLRLEMMNFENRSNISLNYGRIFSAHL
ncbi:retron St85 family effector protein [Pectobacterium aroidearum]|uniref:retron St85 family effector protein n=1 Tax=Pectobacterium aroidearum TaxID=1201031 RepID=UPI001C69EF1E|nr:retron St85 family effector protein [Pectobacterium aroidearum]